MTAPVIPLRTIYILVHKYAAMLQDRMCHNPTVWFTQVSSYPQTPNTDPLLSSEAPPVLINCRNKAIDFTHATVHTAITLPDYTEQVQCCTVYECEIFTLHFIYQNQRLKIPLLTQHVNTQVQFKPVI